MKMLVFCGRELVSVVWVVSWMISNPHDGLFKWVLGQPEHARGELRAVVPAELEEALEWSTLTLRSGSFVDAALAHQHTDLLYSTAWRDGREAPVYFLFEHQSTLPSDGSMAHRLLRYQGRICDRWRSDHPAKKLPVIIPIVIVFSRSTRTSHPRRCDRFWNARLDPKPRTPS